MTLAAMMAEDEDALLCDLAETYHILDPYSLPVETVARLAAGLRENSRIVSKLQGRIVGLDTYYYAVMVDLLRYQLWTQTKDAQKGRNKPKIASESLKVTKKEVKGYSSFDEFDRIRREILG